METEMVLALDRGRAGARSYHLLETFAAWVAKMRAEHAQRQALAYLLELEAYRLDDLGINRADLFAAMQSGQRSTRVIAQRVRRRNDPTP
jgi:uncharacterized protein YjiS (DUF1127 family)